MFWLRNFLPTLPSLERQRRLSEKWPGLRDFRNSRCVVHSWKSSASAEKKCICKLWSFQECFITCSAGRSRKERRPVRDVLPPDRNQIISEMHPLRGLQYHLVLPR